MKIRKILQKDNLDEKDYLNAIIEISASSAQFGHIEEYEGRKRWLERANLNLLIALPLGAGKTTNLAHIEHAFYLDDLTFAGVVGTINKEGELIEGGVLRSAGKVLILDEFNRVSNDIKEAMNKLLEQKWYSRNLGFKLKRSIRKKGKFYEVVAKDNWFKVRVRLSCIASTMIVSAKEIGNYVTQAWFTRFVPVRFIPDYEYYQKLTRGEIFMRVNPKLRDVLVFRFRDYLKAHEKYWNWFMQSKYRLYFDRNTLERGAVNRIFKDINRIAAFIASLEKRFTIRFEDWELAFNKFINYIYDNYIYYNLSDVDKLILEYMAQGKKLVEIADLLGVSKGTVTKRLEKMRRKGLIW